MNKKKSRDWQIRMLLHVVVISIAVTGCVTQVGQVAPTNTPMPPTDTSQATPVNPAVAISPTSGPPGTEIEVTAAGFPPGSSVDLALEHETTTAAIAITAQAGADGTLTQMMAVPSAAEPGDAWVVSAVSQDGGTYEAESNVFQVTAPQYDPQVSISPASGPPGTEVQVVGEGFPPSVIVDVGVGPENAEYDLVDSVEVASDGAMSTIVPIPGFAEPGERWVAVVTMDDRSLTAISNVFEVEQTEYQGTVAISPLSGPVGTCVQVVARGFPPESTVEIGIGRPNSEYDVIATADTDANGEVATQISIPDFVEPDDRWVIVVAAENLPVQAVSEEFDVTPGTAPPQDGNLFSRTNIYLIALGDNGQSGPEIGCDDSVVPVEIEIEPTVAPMTAAFQNLLALETSEYGQSGLYNALYQSDLVVEGIDIENRDATVNLAGTLTLGGVCDEPRVRAQLSQTALQYSTVDRVSIFINGVPLDDLLGQQ